MAFSQENDVILIKLEGTGDPTVYVPPASYVVRGIASFEENDFIVNGGHVTIDTERIDEIIGPELNKKVDKKTTAGLHAYTHNGGNAPYEVPISIAPVEDTLVQRDNDGGAQIETPVEGSPLDIANRGYVQNKIAEIPKSLQYIGPWDASLNTPELDEGAPEKTGNYYIVNVDGLQFGIDWHIGDWIISNGVIWTKLDNTDTPFSTEPEGGRLVMRTPDGRAKVKDAIEPDDAVTKKQLEDIEAQDIVTLADATVLTDQDGLPIEDQNGRYIVPEDVDMYARFLATMDKIGDNSVNVDLSNPYDNMFGTIDNPIEISTESTITFENFVPIPNCQKSFVLYIKRSADVAVHWGDITAWVRNEIPLLPVDKVQKILVETVDGINYYGTGGPTIDV